MSVADAPGKVVALKMPSALQLVFRPKLAVGTSVWFCSHTSAWTTVPPNCRLWLPFSHVVVFSITLVDASRDDWPAPRLSSSAGAGAAAGAVEVEAVAVGVRPHRCPNSGENSVAPPEPPTRNSLKMWSPNVERNDSDVVQRVDCWLPVVSELGKGSCALLVVSGVELMWR